MFYRDNAGHEFHENNRMGRVVSCLNRDKIKKPTNINVPSVYKRCILSFLGWFIALVLFWERYSGVNVTCLFDHKNSFNSSRVALVEPVVNEEKNFDISSSIISSGVKEKPTLPYSDMLLVIFTKDTEEGAQKRATMREIYARYGGYVVSTTISREPKIYSLSVIFLVASLDADENGTLDEDIFWVRAPSGYENIAEMTMQMMSLVYHFSFKYLLKSDDDTFVCLRRLADKLDFLPPFVLQKLYAGVPTTCGTHRHNNNVGRVIMDPKNRWFDQKFVSHTLGGLPCYPVYMQGAFYVLAHSLVEFINIGRPYWITFQNEDVTVGTWLLGVDREVVPIHDIETAQLWGCKCSLSPMNTSIKQQSIFFHDCKSITQLLSCYENFKPVYRKC